MRCVRRDRERETLDDTDSQERAGKAGTQDRHAQKVASREVPKTLYQPRLGGAAAAKKATQSYTAPNSGGRARERKNEKTAPT